MKATKASWEILRVLRVALGHALVLVDAMVPVTEIVRRSVGGWSGQLRSLPILALRVHSACNCRCVMCDIWKANADKREIGLDELERHRRRDPSAARAARDADRRRAAAASQSLGAVRPAAPRRHPRHAGDDRTTRRTACRLHRASDR